MVQIAEEAVFDNTSLKSGMVEGHLALVQSSMSSLVAAAVAAVVVGSRHIAEVCCRPTVGMLWRSLASRLVFGRSAAWAVSEREVPCC
jgi:hypothetical protein